MSAPTAEDRKRLASIEAGQEGHVYDNCYLCWLIARLKEAWAVLDILDCDECGASEMGCDKHKRASAKVR